MACRTVKWLSRSFQDTHCTSEEQPTKETDWFSLFSSITTTICCGPESCNTENETPLLPQRSGPFTLCKHVYYSAARWLPESSQRLWSLKFHIAHRAKRDLWECRKHGAAKGTEAAHLIQASLFWRLCWLYLLPSHTTPLHKPDSPLSQSWCKQQESFVSSQSRAGEWKSTQWHVICIDSTEGLGDDQRCLSGEAQQRRAAVIHEHLKSLGFV